MENLDRLTDAIARRLFVELEASGRHVHVTEAQAQQLFGHGLTPKRPLSQPGQYLAEERVTVTGPKGSLERVAVLGPARKEAQVEVSRTDAVALGVQPPVRLSGDVGGTAGHGYLNSFRYSLRAASHTWYSGESGRSNEPTHTVGSSTKSIS